MYSLTSLFTVWHVNEQREIILKCKGLLETLKLFGSFLVARTVHRQVKSSKNVLGKKKKKTDLEVLPVNFGNLAPDLSEHSCLQYIM